MRALRPATIVLALLSSLLVAAPRALAADRDGDGIGDTVDRCPDQAEDRDGIDDLDGCYDDGDFDHDAILDSKDLCPTLAEDVDGDADADGCPDLRDDKDDDGIGDDADLCAFEPEDRDGFKDDDGCPDPDNDKDKLADAYDRCPLEPEDLDHFDDQDGCPDLDNDQDGLADVDDQCPGDPEDLDGHEDLDGCPDLLIVVTDTHIELKQRIFFVHDSDELQPVSFPLLDEVAAALAERPTMRVRIEGHTDSHGDDDYNLDLSHRRAASVRLYLVGRGLDPERLVAEGFGESRPLGTEDELNRRVEFVILEK